MVEQSENTTGTLTKLLQNGVVVDEDDPVLEMQTEVNMRQEPNGQIVETLGIHDESNLENNVNGFATQNANQQNGRLKPGDVRPPTLAEVMLDQEYLDELRKGNQQLMAYLTIPKLL